MLLSIGRGTECQERGRFLGRRQLCCAVAVALVGMLVVAGQASALIISEFRLRGPSGASDEFVELYNERARPVTISTTDGSAGWALATSNGVARFVVPNGTVIPAGGHYLGVNSVAYSLGSYPAGSGSTATGDVTYTTDIPDNAGLALFKTSNPANFTLPNRLDAVGSTSEINATYKEGTGYPPITPFNIDHSFYRDLRGLTPKDTGNNAADFTFVDTNGTSAGAGQRLGAPGPENLSSPRLGREADIGIALLDPRVGAGAAPNRVRDSTSNPAQNSTFGTLSLRRVLTNNTGAPVRRLRFRIADQTTFPAPAGTADLRDRTSPAVVVGTLAVQGTTLEQPPPQPFGSGFNSTLGVGAVNLGDPLRPGESLPVQLLFGIQQTGSFRVCAYIEALPGGGGLIADGGNTQNQSVIAPTCTPPAPALLLAGKRKQAVEKLSVRALCSHACELVARAKGKVGKGKSREGFKSRKRSKELGAGKARKLKLSFGKKVLRRIDDRKGKAKVTAVATTAAGRTAREKLKIKLKP